MSELQDGDEKFITVNLGKKVLGQFITDLLGQRRILERNFTNRRFSIDLEWLRNLDQIVDQRIQAQNAGNRVSFSARFYFSNGKVLTLEDHRAFSGFTDITSELSVGVALTWVYLVHFPLSQIPEKQEISFRAFTDRNALNRKPKTKAGRYLGIAELDELLGYSIQFTDMTWGDDLSNHIENYITSGTEKTPNWQELAQMVPRHVTVVLGLILGFTISIWYTLIKLIFAATDIKGQYASLTEAAKQLRTIDEKIDFIVAMGIAQNKV